MNDNELKFNLNDYIVTKPTEGSRTASKGVVTTGSTTWYYPYYQYYCGYYPQKSTIEQAFKIVAKLIDKKIIEKKLTVNQFISIVNEVSEVL